MNMNYQCELRCGNRATTGWIEEKGAKVGKKVELKDDGYIYTVIKVYKPGLTDQQLNLQQKLSRGSLSSIKDK